jgi:uncharacterized protein YndB with AHSA1/START domain
MTIATQRQTENPTRGAKMTPDALETNDLGTLDQSGDAPVLRYERHLAHAPEKVWRALTEPDQLAAWFPTTIEGEPVAGAALRFSFPPELPIEPMHGEVVRSEPPRLLEFTWGPDTLRFELGGSGDGTVLRVSVTLDELGKAARDGAGWHSCLELLALRLDDRPDPERSSDIWRRVHPSYVERFGAEASTLGPPQEWEDAHGEA